MTELNKDDRLADSASKIKAPFTVDPTMRFYSPQENVDAFDHPRIAPYLDWIANKWEPPSGSPRLALIIPCTKSKPYSTSREHRSINGALLDAGWEPEGTGKPPEGLYDAIDDGDDPRLLDLSTMTRNGVSLDRIVVSDDEVLIVDYKTNRQPPADESHVSAAYLGQMATYKAALAEVFPGRRVRCALLRTEGPRLMPLTDL